MMTNNYDNIAWCYDLLSKMIFGNAIKKAQVDMLWHIPANCTMMILGGGTGWILEEIAKVHPSGLVITYIDASKRMIQKSIKRKAGLNEVKFISNPVEKTSIEFNSYDVLITPFFFDNFSASNAALIFKQLDKSLKKNGIWLFTDFKISNNERYWQKYLVNLMYSFFRIVCRLEARKLPDTEHYFLSFGYEKLVEKKYYKKFIVSAIFKKTAHDNAVLL